MQQELAGALGTFPKTFQRSRCLVHQIQFERLQSLLTGRLWETVIACRANYDLQFRIYILFE